jgi:uncharacterized protein involved in exopolysaccharide biosynthesis
MEESKELLEILKDKWKVLYKNKWWILGVTIVVAILSFVFTLPQINKPLKEINSTILLINFPKNAGIQQHIFANKFFSSAEFKTEILKKYGKKVDSNTTLDITNFNKRIQVSSSKTDVSFIVRHESAENAAQIINTAIDLFNEKINELVIVSSNSELIKHNSLIETKQQQIDSLKQEMIKFSVDNKVLPSTRINQGVVEVLFSLSGKQEAEKMFKLAQQKSAEMLVIEKDLEQKIIILNQLIKDREKVLGDINMEKDYIMVLSAPNVGMTKNYPNRLKTIEISILLALFLSCGFFLLYSKD